MSDQETTTEVEVDWNPRDVAEGETVWVYGYFGVSEVAPGHEYDVRTSTGHVDSDGDLYVQALAGFPGMYANKWRRPDPEPTTEPTYEWNPVPTEGETIWVYEYYSGHAVTGENGYDVRKAASTYIDSQGDIMLEDVFGKGSYAHKWRRPDPEPETKPDPDAVDWNPNHLAPYTTVWVFEDSNYPRGTQRPDGFAIRSVAAGGIDPDGEILLNATDLPNMGSYARKWRLPATDFKPEVKAGDKVKVLGVIDGCHDNYRRHMMGAVVTVETGQRIRATSLDTDCITVHLPEGFTVDGMSTGTIREWAIIERAEESRPTGISEPAVVDESEPDWKAIIENWRESLNQYACDQEWCQEYEATVGRLFGWSPSRNVFYSVTVKLSNRLYLSDVIDLNTVFGSVDIDLDDENHEFEGDVVITVAGVSGQGPTNEAVREYLRDSDYKFDSFDIVEYEIDTDY